MIYAVVSAVISLALIGASFVLGTIARHARRALVLESLLLAAEKRSKDAEDKLRLAECELAARAEVQREILGTVEPVAASRVKIRPIQ